MSKRSIHAKKIRKLRKLMRNRLPAFIDLADYLQTRGYARNEREALAIIEDGRVRVGSHKLTDRIVPAKHRGEFVVLDATA